MAANTDRFVVKTPQDILELMKDEKALLEYRMDEMMMPPKGTEEMARRAKAMEFERNLPYCLLADFVSQTRDKIGKLIPDDVEWSWEHVGSTSIPGMPGTWNTDALLYVKSFPPPVPVLEAVLANGFQFRMTSPMDPGDLWFFKSITEESVCKDRNMTIHMMQEGNPAGKVLTACRDRCRSDLWAFNDYKNAKLNAIEKAKGNFMMYKMEKGQNSSFLDGLRNEFDMKLDVGKVKQMQKASTRLNRQT